MLYDLRGYDRIEDAILAGEILGGAGAIGNGEAKILSMDAGGSDRLLDGINPGDARAEPRQGLRQNASAAADIGEFKPFERADGRALAPAPALHLLHDEGQPRGIKGVQSPELTPFVPPLFREPFEMMQFFRVKRGVLPRSCLNLHRWPSCFPVMRRRNARYAAAL